MSAASAKFTIYDKPITPLEKRLIILLKIVAGIYTLSVLIYLLGGLLSPYENTFRPPFVINSVSKIGLLALASFFASTDIRRFRILILFVIIANYLAVVTGALTLIWGNTNEMVNLYFGTFSTVQLIVSSMIADFITASIVLWFFVIAEKSQYDLKYLTPGEFRTLVAVAEVVIAGDKLVLSAEEVARNTDMYFASFKARSKWITKLVLIGMQIYPLFSFKAPFSYLRKETRLEFIKKRFYQDVTLRIVPEFLRILIQAMIRMAKQISYLGYYNDPRTYESINYKPFSIREKALHENNFPAKNRMPLKVDTSSEVVGDSISGDVVIIGSGAGASVLAYGLAKAGREVLMIERGDHVDPTTFTEDEVDMLSRLYADGALQLSRDFRFQVLQGSCVGGTTVINNAVCFNMPDAVLDRWNSSPINTSIDKIRLNNSYNTVRNLISVNLQKENGGQRKDFLNHGAKVFSQGLEKMKLNLPPNVTMEVEANIKDCLGCGYCNIGCKYGKKMSMLDTVLPKTQKEFGEKSLRIIAGLEAKKLKSNGSKIKTLSCEFSNGRKIEIKANTFVVSAGAVSSSIILLNSKLGIDNAGKRLSFNMGSPLTAAFKEPVNAYDGLQISHYLKTSPDPGFIIETWYNPPVAQALTMPGWFEDHYRNMLRYDRLSCTGVLVPTASNAEVTTAGLTGREIKFVPTKEDLNRLLEGLMLSGEAFFAGGAESVMPGTFKYYEFKSLAELKKLPEIVKDPSDITLGTGHPQGGNILSGNKNIGCIDPEFKVYGYDNLFVCDASIFPTSLGVNPQLTVMALADYAAPIIAGNK